MQNQSKEKDRLYDFGTPLGEGKPPSLKNSAEDLAELGEESDEVDFDTKLKEAEEFFGDED